MRSATATIANTINTTLGTISPLAIDSGSTQLDVRPGGGGEAGTISSGDDPSARKVIITLFGCESFFFLLSWDGLSLRSPPEHSRQGLKAAADF